MAKIGALLRRVADRNSALILLRPLPRCEVRQISDLCSSRICRKRFFFTITRYDVVEGRWEGHERPRGVAG